MFKTFINSEDERLRDFIQRLPEIFDRSGDVVYEGRRNILKKFTVDGQVVNVKRYRIPRWVNRIFYSYFCKTKAKRAYYYPLEIIRRGFESPHPIAYIEEYRHTLLCRSYFVCQHCTYTHEMREVSEEPLERSRELLIEFTHYTARLHKAGIMHKDYSPGNILYEKIDGKYHFSLVDTNRMKFSSHLGKKECCASFRRLWAQTDGFKLMAQVYAADRGWDEKECETMILDSRKQFWDRYRRRGHNMPFKIDI